MSIPEALKNYMIDNDISVVDLDWKQMLMSDTNLKEVLKWELANEDLFVKARKSKNIKEENSNSSPSAKQ